MTLSYLEPSFLRGSAFKTPQTAKVENSMDLIIKWASAKWYSRYMKGTIVGGADVIFGIDTIYKHATSGKVRLYSDAAFDNVTLSINGEDVLMRSRGRFGRLYVQSN